MQGKRTTWVNSKARRARAGDQSSHIAVWVRCQHSGSGVTRMLVLRVLCAAVGVSLLLCQPDTSTQPIPSPRSPTPMPANAPNPAPMTGPNTIAIMRLYSISWWSVGW